jgi:hypothetical protein
MEFKLIVGGVQCMRISGSPHAQIVNGKVRIDERTCPFSALFGGVKMQHRSKPFDVQLRYRWECIKFINEVQESTGADIIWFDESAVNVDDTVKKAVDKMAALLLNRRRVRYSFEDMFVLTNMYTQKIRLAIENNTVIFIDGIKYGVSLGGTRRDDAF